MKDLLSIIVPVYNVYQYLDKCIDSIIAQTYQNLEIIIVDDGSNDGSSELCDVQKRKDERILVLHKSNGGLSSARNAGIELAKGRYIGFVDSDDYIDPDMYKVLLSDMLTYEADVSMCGMDFITNNSVTHRCGTGRLYLWDRDEGLKQLLTGTLIEPSACCKLYKTESVKESTFDETVKLQEDLPFNVNLFSKSSRVVFRDECLYKYQKRDGSLTTARFERKNLTLIQQADSLLETFQSESRDLKRAALARWMIINIGVYNSGLNSGDNLQEWMQSLDKNIRKKMIPLLLNSYSPMRHKIAAMLIAISPDLYRNLEKKYNQSSGRT